MLRCVPRPVQGALVHVKRLLQAAFVANVALACMMLRSGARRRCQVTTTAFEFWICFGRTKSKLWTRKRILCCSARHNRRWKVAPAQLSVEVVDHEAYLCTLNTAYDLMLHIHTLCTKRHLELICCPSVYNCHQYTSGHSQLRTFALTLLFFTHPASCVEFIDSLRLICCTRKHVLFFSELQVSLTYTATTRSFKEPDFAQKII